MTHMITLAHHSHSTERSISTSTKRQSIPGILQLMALPSSWMHNTQQHWLPVRQNMASWYYLIRAGPWCVFSCGQFRLPSNKACVGRLYDFLGARLFSGVYFIVFAHVAIGVELRPRVHIIYIYIHIYIYTYCVSGKIQMEVLTVDLFGQTEATESACCQQAPL